MVCTGAVFSSLSLCMIDVLLQQVMIVTRIFLTELPSPTVEITDSGDSVAGGTLSLNCSVTTVENLVLPPQVEFLDALGQPLMRREIFLHSPITEGRVTFLALEFSPLVTSIGGQYVCRAIINIPQAAIENVLTELMTEVTVQSKRILNITYNYLTDLLCFLSH